MSVIVFTENGFEQYERDLLDLVRCRDILKIKQLPSDDRVAELLSKDSKAGSRTIDFKIRLYKEKIKRIEGRIIVDRSCRTIP